MDPLITVTQLEHKMQRTLDPDTALQAVTGASGLIRAITRQVISFVADDTVVLGGGDQQLALPQRPVVVDISHPLAVVELGDFGAADMPALEGRDFERLGELLTRGAPWWYDRGVLQGWPWNRPAGVWSARVQVTYSHGYQVIPDDIVALALGAAQEAISNPKLLAALTVGNYSERYAVQALGANGYKSLAEGLRTTGRRRGAFSVRPR